MRQLLSGIIACGSFAVALHFLKFWRKTGDRLFALFAAAFAVFTANGVLLGLTPRDSDVRVVLYVVRLIGFGLILTAIVVKNRARVG